MVPIIGEIRLFSGTFAPRGWAFCHGQLYPITSNTALFSLIGTVYGGDGRTTFALPNLQSKTAVGQGTGPGLSGVALGQRIGRTSNTLTYLNLPTHSHTPSIDAQAYVLVSDATPNEESPENAYLTVQSSDFYNTTDSGKSYGQTETTFTGTLQVQDQGGGQPINNEQPFLALNYIIALTGYYPARS